MMVNEKIKTIFKLVLSQIAEVFPYVLGVYIVCLIISYFFERWKLFFNWPVFHISVILFGILSLLEYQGKRFILSFRSGRKKFFKYQKKISKDVLSKFKNQPIAIKGLRAKLSFVKIALILLKDKRERVWRLVGSLLSILGNALIATIKEIIKLLLDTIHNLAEKLTRKNLIKIGFLAIVLIFLLFRQMNPINFLIMAYGLISILFILESRIAATVALLFLISCPVLLILKKAPFAEAMAVYAYYFLIITVATQLREYCRKERPKKVIHS